MTERLPTSSLQVLLVDPHLAYVSQLQAALDRDGLATFSLTCIQGLPAGVAELSPAAFDAILVDFDPRAAESQACLDQVCQWAAGMPVVACSISQDERDVLLALRLGAQEVLGATPEGWRAAGRVIRQAIERKKAARPQPPVPPPEQPQQVLQKVIASIPVRVFWKDRELRFLGCNQLFADDAGLLGPQDLVGKNDFDMVWREQAELYRADDRQVMETGCPKMNILEPHTNPDSSIAWVRTSKVPMRNAQGEVSGVLGVYEDVTQHKLAEDLVLAQRDLARLSRDILSSQEAWHRCLEVALRISGMDSGGIYLFSEDSQTFELVYHQGVGDDFIQAVAHYPADAPSVQLTRGRQAVYLDADQIRQMGTPGREALQALAIIPILTRERMLGSINLASHTLPRVPDLSRQAVEAIAVEISNVLLYWRAEASLRKSEARYRLLAENVTDVIWIMDVEDGRYRYISPSVTSLLGFSVDEILAQEVNASLAPVSAESLALVLPERLAMYRQGMVIAYIDEIEMPRKDGTSVWLETSTRFIVNSETGRLEVYGVSRDITERKQAQDKLRRMEQRYRALTENAPDGIVMVGMDQQFKYISPSVERMFGYHPEQVQELGPNELTHPEDQPVVQAAMQALIQDPGLTPTLQYRFRHASGEWRWIEGTFSNMLALPGVEAIVVNFHDITGRRKAEEAIRLNNEKLSVVVEIEHALAAVRDEQAAYEVLSHGILRIFPDVLTLFISSFDPQHQVIKAAYGRHEGELLDVSALPELPLAPEGKGLQSQVIHTRQPLIIADDLKERANPARTTRVGSDGEDSRSAVYVPMLVQEEVLGLVNLQSMSPNRFTEQDVWALSLIANTAAVSIQNARLLDVAQKEIAERRQAEEALRSSEALLSEAQRIGRMGYIEWNGRDAEMACSAQVYDILGLPQGSLITWDRLAQLIEPEDIQALQKFDQQFVEQRADTDYEYRIRLANGKEGWLYQHGRVSYDENGLPRRVLAIIQDITTRKQAEEALRRSNQALAVVVEIEHALAAIHLEQTAYEILFTGIQQVFPDIATLFISNFDAERQMIRAAFGWHEGELIDVTSLPEIPLEPEGKGLQSQVIRNHQPLVIGDNLWEKSTSSTATRVGTPGGYTESAVYVPMLVQEQVIGVVQLQSAAPNRFGEQDVWALSLIANTAAVSIQNIRLYGQAQKEIAERRLAEEALRHSEAQLTEAQRIGHIGHIEWSADRPDLVCSAEIYNILDLPPGSVITMQTLASLMTPEERAVLEKSDLESIQQGTGMNYEYRVCLADGRERWLHQQGTITLDENGRPRRMMATIQDITVRKMAVQALHASEEKYRSLMESLDSVIVTFDPNGLVRYINDVAAGYLGGSAESLTGQAMDALFPPEIATLQMEQVRRVFREDRGISFESMSEVQGKPRWYRTTMQPIHDEAGKVIQVLVNSMDIHELKTTQQEMQELNRTLEERIRERTAELQDLYDHAPAGYHSVDVEGRFVRVNQTELSWLGYNLEEVLGRSVLDFITPAGREVFWDDFLVFMQRGYSRNHEFEFVRRDGTIFPVLLNRTAIYDEQGNFIMSRSTLLDITQRKQAEETMHLANLQMERALRLKDEFLANMSHELRTPLTAILGISEILLTGIRGPLNERQAHYVRNIDASGRHLLSLINDLLDVSKIESGKLEILVEQVSIADICQASMSFVKNQAVKKDISLEFIPETSISSVMADPRRLKQILVNLLSNAVKFTPAGGRVELKVHANLPASRLEFAVCDTGIGISAEDLPRLFTPFTQLDSGLSRQYEGTGLGLALVKKLVELHGGEVIVTSEVGKGSCFTVALPWEPSPEIRHLMEEPGGFSQEPLDPIRSEAAAVPNTTILLAEDNEVNVMSIGDYLDSIGYRVIVAGNGLEALELALAERPALVLMDIQMPVMDGMEAIRCLRADPLLAAIPVIALTALAMPGDEQRCLDAGADAYMGKPVQLGSLSNLINQLLQQK
jgi:PAS domain S-box-containing protein